MNEKEIHVVNLDKPIINDNGIDNSHNEEPIKENKGKKVFAIIGFICGIVGLVSSIGGGIGLLINIPGLVFSNIGKKSITKVNYAKKGVLLNTIGIVVNVICGAIAFILWIMIMVGLMEQL